jgi:glycosyltransferase involved in cell wall biosynthesis
MAAVPGGLSALSPTGLFMKLSSVPGREATKLDKPLSQEGALANDIDNTRIVWFMGPRAANLTGVGQHSHALARALSQHTNFSIEAVEIDAKPRSLKRYWHQFVMYPLHAIRSARSAGMIILYQEDLAFMVPIIRMAGGRVCLMFHHIQRPGQASGLVEKLKALYVKSYLPLVPKADLVLVEAEAVAKELIEHTPVKPERVQVVPCPFEDKYAPLAAATREESRTQARKKLAERLGVQLGDAIVLLNVGSDETRKNNLTLFKAMAKLARKDLVIVRAGKAFNAANRQECKALASASDIRSVFTDGVSEEDLGYFYQAADIYLSATLNEGFGRTVIEAQMAGTPVIASDIPVFRGSMGDSFLAIKDPMDENEWAAAISRLVDDPAQMEALRERGKNNALQFSAHVVGAGLHRTLMQALRG